MSSPDQSTPRPQGPAWRLVLEIVLALAVVVLGVLLLTKPQTPEPLPTEEPIVTPAATPVPTPQPTPVPGGPHPSLGGCFKNCVAPRGGLKRNSPRPLEGPFWGNPPRKPTIYLIKKNWLRAIGLLRYGQMQKKRIELSPLIPL